MATWVNCIQAHVLWLINVNRDSKNWVRVNMMISWEADADETNKYAFNKPSLHLYRSCDHTTSPLVTPYKTKETFFQGLCYFLQWWNFIVFEEKKIELHRTSAVQGHPGWLHLLRRICDHSRTAANGPRGQADLAAVPKVKQWNLTQDCAGVVAALVLIHWILKKKTTVLEQHWS